MMAALALYPAAASAQPADGAELSAATGLQISGSVSLVSDYRFRGISQTDIAPAIQPALQLDHASGFFVGFWGSNVAFAKLQELIPSQPMGLPGQKIINGVLLPYQRNTGCTLDVSDRVRLTRAGAGYTGGNQAPP